MKRVIVVSVVILAMVLSANVVIAAGNADSKDEIVEQKAKVKSAKGKSEMTNKVNVNTATKEQLMTLNGVGEAKADAIIEHRKNGKIKDALDLMKIKGIKDKFVEKNKDRLEY